MARFVWDFQYDDGGPGARCGTQKVMLMEDFRGPFLKEVFSCCKILFENVHFKHFLSKSERMPFWEG